MLQASQNATIPENLVDDSTVNFRIHFPAVVSSWGRCSVHLALCSLQTVSIHASELFASDDDLDLCSGI